MLWHDEQELTLGQLIAHYRQMRGVPATDVAERSALHPSQYSRLENDKFTRPDPQLLRKVADALGLSSRQFTRLLCAADHALSSIELAAAQRRLNTQLMPQAYPAYYTDYRGFVWGWNGPFAALFPPPAAAAETGTHSLHLVFDPRFGLCQQLEAAGQDEWRTVASRYVAALWAATRRFINPNWGGEPEWLAQVRGQLSQLPEARGQTFHQMWTEIEHAYDSPGNVPDHYAPERGLRAGEIEMHPATNAPFGFLLDTHEVRDEARLSVTILIPQLSA